MLRFAMLYKYKDIMLVVITVIIVMIICLAISVMVEKRNSRVRQISSMHIINVVTDPSVSIKGFVLVPGTDFLYTPRYSYCVNGKMKTTYSYRKCKRHSNSGE